MLNTLDKTQAGKSHAFAVFFFFRTFVYTHYAPSMSVSRRLYTLTMGIFSRGKKVNLYRRQINFAHIQKNGTEEVIII